MSTLTSGQPVSKVYVDYIKDARQYAINARDMFDRCNPNFPKDHWHWREVEIEKLISHVETSNTKFSKEELKTLVSRLEWAKTRMTNISFNRFCLYIGEAIRDRFKHEGDDSIMCSISEAADVYLN